MATRRKRRGALSVLAFAVAVVTAFAALAFAAGYIVGRILL
jgi:hypothetical protein